MKPGTKVRIKGLVNAAQHNGKVGHVVKAAPGAGRVGVKLAGGGKVLAVKPANLDVLAAAVEDESHSAGPKNVKQAKKKDSPWVAATIHPSFTVTAPPGPLGLTIKRYADDFIISDVSPTCAIPETRGDFPKVRMGDVVTSIDGQTISSEGDDGLREESDEARAIEIAGRIISTNAADHRKGSLLWMKEAGVELIHCLDCSDLAEKYGEDFLEELDPPNKGKSGRQLLAEAWQSILMPMNDSGERTNDC